MNDAPKSLLVFGLSFLCAIQCLGGIDKAGPKTLAADMKRVDALMKVFMDEQARGNQFGDEFWRASKRLGKQIGPRIIHAVVVRCRSFHDETPLIFVPLVALLDRKTTLAILHQYEHAPREEDRVLAREFQIEFEAEDTMKAVAKYSTEP